MLPFESAPDGAVRTAYEFIEGEYDEERGYVVERDGTSVHVYWAAPRGDGGDAELRAAETDAEPPEMRETAAKEGQIRRVAEARGFTGAE